MLNASFKENPFNYFMVAVLWCNMKSFKPSLQLVSRPYHLIGCPAQPVKTDQSQIMTGAVDSEQLGIPECISNENKSSRCYSLLTSCSNSFNYLVTHCSTTAMK